MTGLARQHAEQRGEVEVGHVLGRDLNLGRLADLALVELDLGVEREAFCPDGCLKKSQSAI